MLFGGDCDCDYAGDVDPTDDDDGDDGGYDDEDFVDPEDGYCGADDDLIVIAGCDDFVYVLIVAFGGLVVAVVIVDSIAELEVELVFAVGAVVAAADVVVVADDGGDAL